MNKILFGAMMGAVVVTACSCTNAKNFKRMKRNFINRIEDVLD